MHAHLPVLFHLAPMVFHLVMCYFTFPVQFQLNSDFPCTFSNGQLMCRTTSDVLEHKRASEPVHNETLQNNLSIHF